MGQIQSFLYILYILCPDVAVLQDTDILIKNNGKAQ